MEKIIVINMLEKNINMRIMGITDDRNIKIFVCVIQTLMLTKQIIKRRKKLKSLKNNLLGY